MPPASLLPVVPVSPLLLPKADPSARDVRDFIRKPRRDRGTDRLRGRRRSWRGAPSSTRSGAIIIGGALGAVFGAAIGAVIPSRGFHHHHHRYEDIDDEASAHPTGATPNASLLR